jgi:hypothetical protein
MDQLINVSHLTPRNIAEKQACVKSAINSLIETSLKEASSPPTSHPELKNVYIKN